MKKNLRAPIYARYLYLVAFFIIKDIPFCSISHDRDKLFILFSCIPWSISLFILHVFAFPPLR